MTKSTIIFLCVVVYIVGLIITSLICYIIDVDDDDTIGISIFWPLNVPVLIVFAVVDRNSKEDYEEENKND